MLALTSNFGQEGAAVQFSGADGETMQSRTMFGPGEGVCLQLPAPVLAEQAVTGRWSAGQVGCVRIIT